MVMVQRRGQGKRTRRGLARSAGIATASNMGAIPVTKDGKMPCIPSGEAASDEALRRRKDGLQMVVCTGALPYRSLASAAASWIASMAFRGGLASPMR
jgi:hypothetical protein